MMNFISTFLNKLTGKNSNAAVGVESQGQEKELKKTHRTICDTVTNLRHMLEKPHLVDPKSSENFDTNDYIKVSQPHSQGREPHQVIVPTQYTQ